MPVRFQGRIAANKKARTCHSSLTGVPSLLSPIMPSTCYTSQRWPMARRSNVPSPWHASPWHAKKAGNRNQGRQEAVLKRVRGVHSLLQVGCPIFAGTDHQAKQPNHLAVGQIKSTCNTCRPCYLTHTHTTHTHTQVRDVHSLLQVGEDIQVQCLGRDIRGMVRLSRKACLSPENAQAQEGQAEET
eukprot:1139287-Pelagomonas_calceolata.AAC.5